VVKRIRSFLIVLPVLISACGVNTINTMEENMKSLPTYQKYFFDSNKKLFGIDENGLQPVAVLDQDGDIMSLYDFFSVSGKLYLTVKSMQESLDEDGNPIMDEITTYYEQSNGAIQEVSSIPARPVQGRKQLNNSEFTITNNVYNGQDVSDLQNIFIGSGIERFILLNAYCYFQGVGLWIYVKEGRGDIRPEGLYYWPVDKPSLSRVKGKGEIW